MLLKGASVLSINHQLGKITLHATSSKEAGLRVRKLADGTLETLERAPGGTWRKATSTLHAKFLKVVLDLLVQHEAAGYYYLNHDVVKCVNRRFSTVKQT